MTSKELIGLLKSQGCVFVRHGKGDHQIWYSPVTGIKFTVPHPKRNLPRGTIHSIKRASGINVG
ncbi:type II toxin-antitoxin system HicA family toxin [Paraneptunicella aestuarii]|nr:type II toxin-antitoxin system HicA family toxin [Paraneptunicella aestuarii]UAA40083.1 type II toxin-antitoxin system HicA family toxin [Paraneptunicella aestuarii]